MMRRKLCLLGILCLVVLTVASMSSVASAISGWQTFQLKNKEIAFAQWIVMTGTEPNLKSHTINAIVNMSNSEDGWIYVTIMHASGSVSVANAHADFTWTATHVIVEASVYFDGPSFKGIHNITMTWSTSQSRDSRFPNCFVDSHNGMTAKLKGDWRIASAEFVLDPTATSGHHRDDTYNTGFAFIGKSDATISIATSIPP